MSEIFINSCLRHVKIVVLKYIIQNENDSYCLHFLILYNRVYVKTRHKEHKLSLLAQAQFDWTRFTLR